jgi:hypothetical protein
MYGGVNPQQSFDSVVILETSFGSELDEVADELYRMSTGSSLHSVRGAAAAGMGRSASSSRQGSPPERPGSAAAAAATGVREGGGAGGAQQQQQLVPDLMKLQLRDLLVKRNMEEMHMSASRKVGASGLDRRE